MARVGFVQAARDGRLEELQRMQSALKSSDKDECLEAAVGVGQLNVVRWLLDRRAHASVATMCSIYVALASECTSDRESIARLLHKNRESTYEPFDDPSVVTEIIARNNAKVLTLLIKRGANVDGGPQTNDAPLFEAISCDSVDMVRLLLKAGAKVDIRATNDGSIGWREFRARNQTALMIAASYNFSTAVRLLLERGASVAEVDSLDETALMHAFPSRNCGKFDLEVVRLLVDTKSIINVQSLNLKTALMMAACNDTYEEAVELLLEAGASVDLADSKNWTALMYASSKGSVRILKLLLNAGSPLNAQSRTGETALMILTKSNSNYSAVQLLLDHGASIDITDYKGWTPLMTAAFSGTVDLVPALKERGASLEAQTNMGDTVFSLAQMGDHEEIVALLLNRAQVAVQQKRITSSIVAKLASRFTFARIPAFTWFGVLMAACTTGDKATVLELIPYRELMNQQTETGESALMRAVWNQHMDIVFISLQTTCKHTTLAIQHLYLLLRMDIVNASVC